MFGVLSDPSVFSNKTGIYVAGKHLHDLLTVEQLFRRVSSIQTTHRDANARRTLLFTILDTVQRLTSLDITKLCSLRYAKERLALLEASIQSTAAEVLLPNARRATQALEQLQDGFFIGRHTNEKSIVWNDPQTGPESLRA
jgi:hypothetical protein